MFIFKMKFNNYSIYIFFIFILNFITADIKYPIILVPGDGGSQLEAKLDKPSVVHYICDKKTNDYFTLWLNVELLMPIVIDCLIDNMKLIYDNNTRTTSNTPGVYTRIPGFGNCSTVEWIDPSKISAGNYFKDIGNKLVTLGYQGDHSLRGAPYDFRKGPSEHTEYFENLKNLIEQTYVINGYKKVILIVHSLGALVSTALLRQETQEWKDKYIRAMISLAGVWGGSVKAVKVYAVGDDLGVYMLQGSVLRAEQISSPSLAWLLPSPYIWKDEIFVETPTKNYSLNNIQDFFTDINYEVGWEMYKDAYPYIKNFDPPGVELYCIYGYGVPTVEKLYYKEGAFPKYPVLISGDGDGTVNKRSLQACTYWSEMQKYPIHEIPIKAADHMSIIKSNITIHYITSILQKL